ncbi:MAG: cyclic nucleotide-binding domain-containing protein [Sterolibacterium sp.]
MIFYQLFSHNPEIVRCHAGEYLFNEGEDGDRMYVLASGQAEVLLNNEVVETTGSGDIVGELAVIEPGPRSASVRACCDCEFVAIDQKRFDYLVSQTPNFATHVMRIMARRLRRTNRKIH